MKTISLFLLAITMAANGYSQEITDPKATEVWDPEPKVVAPGHHGAPTDDAIILFDGRDFSNWITPDGKTPGWALKDGTMTVEKGTGDIQTRQVFGDIQLHIEWRTPPIVEGEGQGRGNSGIFFQERYELQVLDSYKNRTYSNGQAGSIYKQTMPLVNASRGPGEWQTYDIVFIAPVFNDNGSLQSPGKITVFHNGVLVQNNTTIRGTTEYIGRPKNVAHGKGAIRLQDHGNPVSFRNIWLREL